MRTRTAGRRPTHATSGTAARRPVAVTGVAARRRASTQEAEPTDV